MLNGIGSIHIDNITSSGLGSVALNALLTTEQWSDRKLGKSETVTLPARPLVAASGNNVTVRGDTVRRTLRCHIDPKVERPERRTFEITDLPRYIHQNRQVLLTAAFTILAAYRRAGRPGGRDALLGSFEQWSEEVAGAVRWIGLPDPVDSQAALSESDPVSALLGEILAAWHAVFGDEAKTAGEVLKVVEGDTLDGVLSYSRKRDDETGEAYEDRMQAWREENGAVERLKEAVHQAVPAGKGNANLLLGKYISNMKDRVVDGLAFEAVGAYQGARRWIVRS